MVSPTPSKPSALRPPLPKHPRCPPRVSPTSSPSPNTHWRYPDPETRGQIPSLLPSPTHTPPVYSRLQFSPTLLIPPDPAAPHFHSSRTDTVPTMPLVQRKINAKSHFLAVCFHFHFLAFLQAPQLPALLLREFWLCGDSTVLASTKCPVCIGDNVLVQTQDDPRLAVVAALASFHRESGHWTRVTARGRRPG